jgi:uncharacterized protein
VANRRFETGLLIHQEVVTAPWGPGLLRELTIDHLADVMASPPEVLLIGTGRVTSFPCDAVMKSLEEARIGFECMDTHAAARTYNILVTEGRAVSAAMLPSNG